MATGTDEFLYHYKAKINSVYDGDGVYEADVFLGLGISAKKELRLYGVDCPEMKFTHRLAGIVVRDYVRTLILDKTLVVKTHKDHNGKYGRLLVDVFIGDKSLADILIDLKYAKEYFGDTKTPWTYEELQYVVNHPHGDPTLTYLEQWTSFATASSEYSNEIYAAKQVVGAPDTGFTVGSNQADSPKAWAEATEDKQRINTIMCGFDVDVYISGVQIRETYNAGAILKLEVLKGNDWQQVFIVIFGSEQGGKMTGVQTGKISDTIITLNTPLSYLSNKIRLSVGDGKAEYNEIDAVRLLGMAPPQ